MSDTPETDALIEEIRSKPSKGGCIPKDFARKLERERDEAKRLYSNAQALARILVGQREVVIAERDQLKCELQAAHIQRDLDKKSDEERDQLRKTVEELETRHAATMLHTQTVVDENTQLRKVADGWKDTAEMLMAVVCNASGGDWKKESKDFQEAARRYVDEYYERLKQYNSLPHVVERNKTK